VVKATGTSRTTIAKAGLLTALSQATVMGLSGFIGIVIARQFGRGAETDGFFAAFGLFVVLVLGAAAFRLVVLPDLARARELGRLRSEAWGFAAALGLLALPALAVSVFAPDWLAAQLTGSLPDEAQRTAAEALRWMVPAAIAQLYAGLAASVLAALDDYGTAAFGYAAGSVASVTVILLRVDADGISAVAWGMFVNAAISLGVPVAVLLARTGAQVHLELTGARGRLALFVRGVTLPLALQGLYVVCLRFAGEVGVGQLTSFSYAYLLASAFVAVTASSLSLVSSVPLTRTGIDGLRAGRHVVNISWLALTIVAGAAGVFAVSGEALLRLALGDAFSGDVGSELGRLVVYLSLWMVASVGLSVAYPLLFVRGRGRFVPLLSIGGLLAHVPIAWAGYRLLGLPGVAVALGVTTAAVLGVLLSMLSFTCLECVARGLVEASAFTGLAAALSFGVAALLLPPAAAGLMGLLAYVALLGLLRPGGLREAWRYVHAFQ
jgi:hypothetical protein